MIGIYSQQLGVVEEFHKCLEQLNGHPKYGVKERVDTTWWLQHGLGISSQQTKHKAQNVCVSCKEFELLDDMIEEVDSRKTEIEDLEHAALNTCQQVRPWFRLLYLV